MTPHVLLVLRGFEADGPGRLVLDVLRAWSPEGVRASAVSLREEGPLRAAMEREIARLGGRVAAIPMQFYRARRAGQSVAALAREWRADVLHAHLLRADMTARLAAEEGGLPLLVTEHGIHGWGERGPLLRPLVRRWYLRTLTRRVTVCAISRRVMRDLLNEGVPPRRVIEVRNGVDVSSLHVPTGEERAAARSALGLPRDAFPLVLALGSLIERKAPMQALEAVARLRRAMPSAVLAFAGEGPLEPTLRSRAAAMDVGGAVRFLGQLPSPVEALSAADLLVHAAREEPFGLAIAEALCCGLPVVARADAGPADLLPPNPGGWLVQGDDAGAWAHALQAAAESVSSAPGVAALCRRHAEEHLAIAQTAAGYLAAYREALGEPPSA